MSSLLKNPNDSKHGKVDKIYKNNAEKKFITAINTGNESKIKKALPSYVNTRPNGVLKPVQLTNNPTSQQRQQTSQQQPQQQQPQQQQPQQTSQQQPQRQQTSRQRQRHLPQRGWVDYGLLLLMIAIIIGLAILPILFSSSNTSDTDDDNEEDFNNYYYNTDTICQCDKCKNFNITNNIMPYNI